MKYKILRTSDSPKKRKLKGCSTWGYQIVDTKEEAEKFAVDHIDEAKITIFKKEKEMERPLTLREYMQENASGAYHNFIFEIAKLKCNVIGVDDFETYYNKDLLDRFYVLSDAEESYGDNCENYGCDHHLTLQMIPVTK